MAENHLVHNFGKKRRSLSDKRTSGIESVATRDELPTTWVHKTKFGLRESNKLSSIVSLDGDSPISDEESLAEVDLVSNPAHRVAKKQRILRKVVKFADSSPHIHSPVNQTMMQITSSPNCMEPPENLYWSRLELRAIRLEGKLLEATDTNVQDYNDAFQRLYDKIVVQATSSLTDCCLTSDKDSLMIQVGLMEGWRGLESFASGQASRHTRVRATVRRILAFQKTPEYSEMAAKLSEPSIEWAKFIGIAEQKAANCW